MQAILLGVLLFIAEVSAFTTTIRSDVSNEDRCNNKIAYFSNEPYNLLYTVTTEGITVLNRDGSLNNSRAIQDFDPAGVLLDASTNFLWVYGSAAGSNHDVTARISTSDFPFI